MNNSHILYVADVCNVIVQRDYLTYECQRKNKKKARKLYSNNATHTNEVWCGSRAWRKKNVRKIVLVHFDTAERQNKICVHFTQMAFMNKNSLHMRNVSNAQQLMLLTLHVSNECEPLC